MANGGREPAGSIASAHCDGGHESCSSGMPEIGSAPAVKPRLGLGSWYSRRAMRCSPDLRPGRMLVAGCTSGETTFKAEQRPVPGEGLPRPPTTRGRGGRGQSPTAGYWRMSPATPHDRLRPGLRRRDQDRRRLLHFRSPRSSARTSPTSCEYRRMPSSGLSLRRRRSWTRSTPA